MDLLTRYNQLLCAQRSQPSPNTVKNYLADLRSFFTWFEITQGRSFVLSDFDMQVINAFTQQSPFSQATNERRLASIKKFYALLKTTGENLPPLFEVRESNVPDIDIWRLGDFKYYLRRERVSQLTIKNYLADIHAFKKWFEATNSETTPFDSFDTLTLRYKDTMIHVLGLSPASVNRKLSTLRKYLSFAYTQGLAAPNTEEKFNHFNVETAKIEPRAHGNEVGKSLSSLDAFRIISSSVHHTIAPLRLIDHITQPYSHFEERLAFHFATKAKQFKRVFPSLLPSSSNMIKPLLKMVDLYQKNPVFRFTTLSLFFLGITATGTIAYMKFYYHPRLTDEILGIQNANTRVLSYSGTLTNTDGSPITSPTSIGFKLYTEQNGENYFWHEQHTVTPTNTGLFQVNLGNKTSLPAHLLTENQNVYLGVQVGGNGELSPRQPIANVGYALNSKTLQGMSPITQDPTNTTNAILALDSSGNLSIGGSANPIFQATGGEFTIKGSSILLTTNAGSSGNIGLRADGIGIIDVQSPIANTDEPSASSSGAVEFADDVIIASDSATSLLTVENTGEFGDIIRLLSRNTTRLVVDNTGNVGIGATTPSQLVHLAHTSSPTLRIENLGSGNTLDLASLTSSALIGTNKSHALGFKTNDITRMTIDANGNVGIGTQTPTAMLDIAGNVNVGGNLTLTGTTQNIQTANNSNLTIGGNTTGNILLQPLNGAGFVGIGNSSPEYALDVLTNEDAKSAMQIYNASTSNESDGLVIKLGNNTTNNNFLTFQTHNSGLAGSISANGSEGIEIVSNDTADFAEFLKKNADEPIPYGSLVCISKNNTVTKCSESERNIVGVASDRPTILGGKNLGNRSIAVGLVGVVETSVTTTQGSITSGDPISVSQESGIGSKATSTGMIAGRALESLSTGDGKIKVLVQPTWFIPHMSLIDSGELITTEIPHFGLDASIYQNITQAISESQVVTKHENSTVKLVVTYAKATIGKIKAGVIEAQSALITGTLASSKIITEQLIVTSDNISVDGKPLSEYIAQFLPANEFSSPSVQAREISTQIISPLAEDQDVAVRFDDSSLVIGNRASSGSASITLGANGNAEFQGSIAAQNASLSGSLNAENASVSGILTADTIKANTIDGLEEKVTNFATEYMRNNQQTQSPVSPSFTSSNWHINEGSYTDIASVSANFALFHDNLLSLGSTTLREASILESFTVGNTLTMGSDSLNVLGSDLHIQPLRQGGISFLSGLVAINQEGNLTVGGDASFAKNVTVSGGIFANIISPLPEQNIDFILNDKSNGDKTSLNVQNGLKTSVFSVFNNGDVLSSGSAQFAGDLVASGSALISKLNIFSQDAQAVSENTLVADSSAGTATLPAYKKEITIQSPYATPDSLIYITPSTDTKNQVLYLMRQSEDGSFTVGIAEQISQPIQFNWFIVN